MTVLRFSIFHWNADISLVDLDPILAIFVLSHSSKPSELRDLSGLWKLSEASDLCQLFMNPQVAQSRSNGDDLNGFASLNYGVHASGEEKATSWMKC